MKLIGKASGLSFFINCFIFIITYINNQVFAPFWIYAFGFLGVFLILYFWFKYHKKKQLQSFLSELEEHFPELREENKKHATDLSIIANKIHAYKQDQSTEIDFLLEQENYRREFLGNVSHELKTPLFSIQGFLLTLIEGGLGDENIRDKYLNRINKSVERLIYIVKDLDLISELESGNLRLEKRSFNIHALTQEVFDLLEQKAANNAIIFEFDRLYEEPVRVIGDIERIEQVLINLLSNAINHSSRPTKVIVSFLFENGKIKVEITDYGVGIKPEQLPRIFERFYRVDRSRSRTMGGSGLGLAIVKHILEAHDQKVYVESEYGRKTTFWFYLEESIEN